MSSIHLYFSSVDGHSMVIELALPQINFVACIFSRETILSCPLDKSFGPLYSICMYAYHFELSTTRSYLSFLFECLVLNFKVIDITNKNVFINSNWFFLITIIQSQLIWRSLIKSQLIWYGLNFYSYKY